MTAAAGAIEGWTDEMRSAHLYRVIAEVEPAAKAAVVWTQRV